MTKEVSQVDLQVVDEISKRHAHFLTVGVEVTALCLSGQAPMPPETHPDYVAAYAGWREIADATGVISRYL